MIVFLSRIFIAIYSIVSFHCFSSSDYHRFKGEWKSFLDSRDFDSHKNSKKYEFYLLNEFSREQMDRFRPFIPTIDRYDNCCPYLENKVTLRDGTEISASYINLSGSKNHYQNFIASQAPYRENIRSFWKMILEKKIEQIVMLTELFENPQWEFACRYWPQQIGEKMTFDHEFAITLIDEEELFSELTEKIQIRKINLQYHNKTKIITHYWYRNWINDSVPKQFETILTLMKKIQHSKKHERNMPILVHCSGGVGRTGIFIVLYHLMQRIKKYDKINLFHLVAYLRWQRPLIMRLDQYKYCYEMYEALKQQLAPSL